MNPKIIILIVALFLAFLIWKLKKTNQIIEGYIMDKITEKKIAELHPAIRDKAKAMILEAEKQGIHLRIYEALRSFERQLALYNQPWDKKDNDGDGLIDESDEKVTNAKPGDGFHNYALAFDLVEMKDGRALWDNDRWPYIGLLGEKHGLAWGGRWRMRDLPHFQIKNVALSHLKNAYAAKRFNDDGFIQLT